MNAFCVKCELCGEMISYPIKTGMDSVIRLGQRGEMRGGGFLTYFSDILNFLSATLKLPSGTPKFT